MWQPFQKRVSTWDLGGLVTGARRTSAQNAAKDSHELRLLELLLPVLLPGPPVGICKRESPDFEIKTPAGSSFVEHVDAVPDALDESGRTNLAKRRSRPNQDFYRVDPAQFGAEIARVIKAKCAKAIKWLQQEPQMAGRLVLLVNGGLGPMPILDYFRDHLTLGQLVPLSSISPFTVAAIVDERGAYVWT